MAEDVIWEALSRALVGEYDILTRLGFGRGDAPVYLARELVTDTLVGLRLPPLSFGSDSQEYGLEVVRQLDSSLPDIETRCSHCGATLRQWSRFCSKCGRDISGIAPSATGAQTRETLRALASQAAADKYDVIGEMSRAEGGGLVYFARELSTGKVVGLQIEPGPEATVTMTETQFEALGDTLKIEQPRRPSTTDTGRRLSIPRGIEHQPPPPPPPALTRPSKRELGIGIIALAIIAAAIFLYQLL